MELQQILSAERVHCDANIHSKKRALEKLSELIASSQTEVTELGICQSLIERERLGSTGLGHGVAIPHGRTQSSGATLGAFIKLKTPIDYDAIDKAPVDLLFALCIPQQCEGDHLHLLSLVAQMFSDKPFCEKIRAIEDDALLFQALLEWRPQS